MKNKFLLLLSFLCAHLTFSQQIMGSWKGELNVQGNKLPLIINIKQDKETYISTLDSPLQGAEGIPMDKTTFKNSVLSFENSAMGAKYVGTLKNNEISGTFSQKGMNFDLILKPFDKSKNTDKSLEFLKLSDLKISIPKIENFLTKLEENNETAGEISIFKDGKEIYKRNFGEKNLPDYKSSNKVFQIGSISKSMTAIMIYKMIEQKKLNLNDKLSQFYPQIPNAKNIEISNLLNHTSGLGDYVTGKENPRWLTEKTSEKQTINRIIEQGTLFEVGKNQQYSNSGYFLLAKILEKVSKKSYEENLNEFIVKPLQLKDFYTATQNPTNIYPSFTFRNKWEKVKDFDFKNIIGVGDISTTPQNLNIIINALFDEKLVSENSIHSMIPEQKRFGRGLAVVPFHSKIFIGHSGGTYGTNSLMIYNGEDNISIAYSLNADKLGIAGNEFIIAILSMLYGVDYELPKNNQ